MSKAPKKFFSIRIANVPEQRGSCAPEHVFLNVFNLDGPEPHPDDSEKIVSNLDFGDNGSFNIATAIKFALDMEQ